MPISPLERLHDLGLTLPQPPAAVASYIPVRSVWLGPERSLLHVAGQIPVSSGRLAFEGRVPSQVSVERAQEAARLCALNILAHVERAAGLHRVEQLVQLTAFVLSDQGFGRESEVVNAASDLMLQVLGEAGRHARVAVGVASLPLNSPVEIAAVVQVGPG
ncbi:MAG: RidA family protein [Candidatus Dormibacterales bacterium]